MLDRLISAGVAVLLGFLVWLYARSRDQEMLDNQPLPVQIVLAPGQAEQYDLEVTGPSQVTASFSGPPSRMRELRGLLQRGGLHVQVTLNVPADRQAEARYHDTVRVDASDIHTPPGVRAIVAEGRDRVPVTLRHIVERTLPVKLNCALEGRVRSIAVEPAKVVVRGPQDILDHIRDVPTLPYLLPPRPDSSPLQESVSAGSAGLVQELEGRPIRTDPRRVAVRITLQPEVTRYDLVDVPVQFLCPANFGLRPRWENERAGKITLHVTGPTGSELPPVAAYIDLTGRKFDEGLYADEPLRLQLPKDFVLDQAPPRSATFRLLPIPSNHSDAVGLGGFRNP